MGRLAADLSDVRFLRATILDPSPLFRSLRTCSQAYPLDTDPIVELDRSSAIKRGIDLLAASDVLVILGKGHERFQEIEGVSHPFSDREVAEGWIKQGADHLTRVVVGYGRTGRSVARFSRSAPCRFGWPMIIWIGGKDRPRCASTLRGVLNTC